MDHHYREVWLDTGHNPWPMYDRNRWQVLPFETYAVVDENNKLVCITGRYKEDYEQAKEIAKRLNYDFDTVTTYSEAIRRFHLIGHPDMSIIYDPHNCPWCSTHTKREIEAEHEAAKH